MLSRFMSGRVGRCAIRRGRRWARREQMFCCELPLLGSVSACRARIDVTQVSASIRSIQCGVKIIGCLPNNGASYHFVKGLAVLAYLPAGAMPLRHEIAQ